MREEFSSTSAASLRRRTAIGVVLGVLGIAASVAGFASGSAGTAAQFTALGLVAVVIAAMLLSPIAAKWVISPLGKIFGRGVVARLARTNAVRNPRRTAATGFALTLGLVLVAGIAVIGASFKASLDKLFSDNVTADYILTTSSNGVNVPIGAAQAAAQVDGVQSVTQLQTLVASVDGNTRSGSSVDGPLKPVLRVDMTQGSPTITGRNMIVSQTYSKDHDWTMGTRHTLSVPGRGQVTTTVTGIYKDDNLIGDWAVDGSVYRLLTPPQRWADDVALVHAKPGADLGQMRTDLEKAVNGYYIVDVRDLDQFKGFLADQINGLLGLLYALLALAIIIAILGIINTQALSVVERRREIGMLRTVGMQRKQVRRTIYLESLLIAVFGAVLGVLLGLAYGSLFAHTLRSQGLDVLAVPWVQAVLFLVLAAIVGVLAALWPGFRAARTPPLDAIRTG
jgi:putative ABC transport system permease protein